MIGVTVNVCAEAKNTTATEDWSEKNIISSRETAVDINDDASAVITRVFLNKQNNVAIKLRELAVGLRYGVSWNESERCVILKNSKEVIKIYVDSAYCEKNGKEISINNSVFIDGNYSYCSQPFIEEILNAHITNINIGDGRRIDGVSLYVPYLPATSRAPFPETSLSVDGKPLYIDYFENIAGSLPYNTVFSDVKGSNGSGEQVIIYTEATLKDFRISTVSYNNTSRTFKEGKAVLEARNIAPPIAVRLNTIVSEGVPAEVVIFIDSKGITHSYLLNYNGKSHGVLAVAVEL